MNKVASILLLLFLFKATTVKSQGEANIWYFGDKAGLDFNSGVPVPLTDSEMDAFEGCASLANAAGQLLFYTNGIKVWNRNHQVMLNGDGLLGHDSSTQSGTIIPMPGSANLFYLFTLDFQAFPNGVRYSIIDLNLDGGLGGVTSTKNVLLYSPSCEKISVVKHANETDFWIVTRAYNNNIIYSHLLNSSGLSTTPVMSNSSITADHYLDTIGNMKISPNGSKLAICYGNTSNSRVELLDFNNATGQASNPQIIDTGSGSFYGVEFSPNGSLLYVTEGNNFNLFQYDLNAVPIISSRIHLFDSEPMLTRITRSLQLGPDGKIYVAMASSPALSVINKPNVYGFGCEFVVDAIPLAGKISGSGLPVFNQSFFFTAIQLQNSCVGEVTTFQLGDTSVSNASWNFGDGTTSNLISPTHIYTNEGTYSVSVTTTGVNGISTATKNIIVYATPTATTPTNSLICDANNDGFYNFDLTTKTTTILNGQSPTQYGVRYFANATDYANNIAIANPNSYQNTIAYQVQTIIAEVYNLDNQNCKATTTFDIQVFESPLPSTTISPIQLCDNTSFGNDVDGKVVFNLTSKQSAILNGQSATDFALSYYKDAALTDLISNPTTYVNTNVVETIYVKMTNNQNVNCFATTSFQIEVFTLPSIISPIPLKQCDDNNDGFSAFNLTEANELVVASTTGLSFSYFETLIEAQNNSNPIVNFTSYTNQLVSTDQVFIRIQNPNGCFRIATLNLIVSTTLIPATFQIIKTECDDVASGSNTDGIATFDFSEATAQIQALYPIGQVLVITYYQNITDALAEQNAITNISNYSNIGYPNSQNIFVRVDSQLDNECLGLGHHITLNVERIPIVQPQLLNHCDDDQDGIFGFDTTNLQASLLNGLTNVAVYYTDQSGNPITMTNPFVSNTQTINVKVKNTFGKQCEYDATITFTVDDLPEAFAIPTSLTTVCDDELDPTDQDGLFAFDTSSFQSTILGTQTGMIVNYFDGMGNPLLSPLPNPLMSGTQNITVEVINPLNTICKATMIIPLVVNPLPEIELYGDELICSNNPLFTKVINAGLLDETTISSFTYQWFLDGSIISTATNYDLTVNTEGIYTVEVTNSSGCKRTRTITVTASDIATINDVEIVDLSDENSVTVLVSGLGNYEFSLDNIEYQSSNVFQNIASGIYTVYVRDLNGCGVATEEISVLGIPNYFTPNGDGYNDYWNVKGVNSNFNLETTIHIFDRYGKLLKQISPLSQGWDGTFNGVQMPSSDYWYSIQLEDGRILKGHFSLKR
jgi:gliding motility-associated-like protein